jgi:hypothetical protein
MGLKPTDRPQFSRKWWTSGKPADIKGVDLEKALQTLEKVLAEDKKRCDEETVKASCSALDDLESAIEKLISKECDKKKHKDLLSVIDKFDGLIKSERKRLEEALRGLEEECSHDDEDDEEDDEEDEGKLFEKDFLYKMIKILRSSGKPLNFGFGLNTSSPESSQLLLKRKGKPEMLFKALKKTGNYSNRTLVCGTALADPEDAKVLVLRVEEGDEPPQILKLGRKFLRGDKTLKFRKMKIVINGKTLVDNDPDDEDENLGGAAGASAELQARLRSAATAASVWTRSRDSANNEIAQLRRELAAFDEPGVASIRDQLATCLDGYPDLDLTALAGCADQAAFERSLEKTRLALIKWRRILESDQALRTIDENPFGVKTNLVGRFGDALGVIADQLKL